MVVVVRPTGHLIRLNMSQNEVNTVNSASGGSLCFFNFAIKGRIKDFFFLTPTKRVLR